MTGLTSDQVTNLSALPALPLPFQLTDIVAIYRTGLPEPAYQGSVSALLSLIGFTVLDMNSPTSAPYALVNGNLCNVHSSVAPQVGNLPPAATGGLYVEVMDFDNNLAVKNCTINAHGGDVILDYATSAAVKTLTLSNGVWRFVPNNGVWRVLSV